MPKNIKPMNLPLFYINLVLFLIPLIRALLSKMAGLSANFVIFLMLFVLLLLPLLLLNFGGKLLLLPFTPSIGVLLPLFRIKLLMICCLVLLPPMTYLESLDVSVFDTPPPPLLAAGVPSTPQPLPLTTINFYEAKPYCLLKPRIKNFPFLTCDFVKTWQR